MRYESIKTAKGNIGVSYVSQKKANEQAEIMDANDCTDCTGCTDCTDCTGCTDCTDCKYCTDCTGCKYCTDCTGCTDCTAFAANKPITNEDQIARLDQVRDIILANESRLEMTHWHDNDEWKNQTVAEVTSCGTTHCLAGWLQVCSTDPLIRKTSAESAGRALAPIAAKLFYDNEDEVIAWLRDREYVNELGATGK